MKMFFLILIMLFQTVDELPDVQPPPEVATVYPAAPAPTTAFGSYLPLFGNLMLAAGALVGLMASARIYMNWNLGMDNIWKNTMNLWLGCVMLVTVRFLIYALV